MQQVVKLISVQGSATEIKLEDHMPTAAAPTDFVWVVADWGMSGTTLCIRWVLSRDFI